MEPGSLGGCWAYPEVLFADLRKPATESFISIPAVWWTKWTSLPWSWMRPSASSRRTSVSRGRLRKWSGSLRPSGWAPVWGRVEVGSSSETCRWSGPRPAPPVLGGARCLGAWLTYRAPTVPSEGPSPTRLKAPDGWPITTVRSLQVVGTRAQS